MTVETRALRGARPLATTATAVRVQRFTRTERTVHWVQALSFLVLLVSGFVLALPALESAVGHRELLREIHLTGAFLLFFGPTAVALAGDRASLGRDVRAVDGWDRDDLRWLVPFPILRSLGIGTPPQGRFNAGQKLNAIFVAWSTLAFGATGLIMWQNRRFPLDVVSQANTIHTALAYLALAAFLGHFYLAAIYPRTRHALHAITQGWVHADWAAEHHPKWARTAPVWNEAALPPRELLRSSVQAALGFFAFLFASRLLFFGLGANVTDKVTARLYDLTAWPGVASLAPQTGVRLTDWPALGWLLLLALAWLLVDRLRERTAG